MKTIRFIMVVCFTAIEYLAHSQSLLHGRITDANDHTPVVGASITVTEFKTGAVSDLNGYFTINNLPARNVYITVHAVGYMQVVLSALPGRDTVLKISLNESVVEAGEVVVTGSAFSTESDKSSLPVVPLERRELLINGAGNFADALTRVAGVSSISTGNAISKPVIRGLGYNRIITINEGVRQEGQQWGDEHGLEIDQFNADRVEILKGPASLLYGSDALGGVINILEPVPAPLGTVRGEVSLQGASNNRMGATSVMTEGNENGFVWRARGSFRSAGSYHTPDEWVYNSSSKEMDGNLFLGINRKWGFSHLHVNSYDTYLGLVEGERDSATNRFLNAQSEIVPDQFSRERNLPIQRVQHFKVSTVNSWYVGESNLRFIAGYQENTRSEYVESDKEAGLLFQLRTLTGDLKYYLPEKNGWRTVAGMSTMLQNNANLGYEYLIPNYKLQEGGGFISVNKEVAGITWNAGVRVDARTLRGEELLQDSSIRFAAFERTFTAWSGSFGAAWKISDDFNLKFNAGRGFRAPGVAELSSNGIHEGTFRYEIGNTALNPETTMQFDLGVDYARKKFSVELSAYYNRINNFIYYRNFNGEELVIDHTAYPVYRFVQDNSLLYGFEASLDFHPLERVHFEHTFAYVYGVNCATKNPLPYIPPFRYRPELRYVFSGSENGKLKECWIKAGADFIAHQYRVDPFETTTNGAVILNAGAGISWRLQQQWVTCSLMATNLTNTIWYDHLSRLKDAGIAGMGRNFILNVSIPFGFHSAN